VELNFSGGQIKKRKYRGIVRRIVDDKALIADRGKKRRGGWVNQMGV